MGLFNLFAQEKKMNTVKQLGVTDISELYQNKNYIMIDVREPDEWVQGVIPGVKKISLGNIDKLLPTLDKNANYILVCRSGGRSDKAAGKMTEAGFKNIINFRGGMLDWYSRNLPLEK